MFYNYLFSVVVNNVFEFHLSDYKYDKNTAPDLASKLSNVIKDKVKHLGIFTPREWSHTTS